MRSEPREHYNGVFIPRDASAAGQLVVAGKDTTLKLVSKEPWKETNAEFFDYHGFLTDGTKASLLQCVQTKRRRYRLDENAQYELNLFPHFILIGERFITSEEPVIRALHYHFENVGSLVNALRTFGTIRPEPREFRQILEADHTRHSEIARRNGRELQPFEPEIGDRPLLMYYSGLWEIAKCEAQIGTVIISNRISYGPGGSTGVAIDNAITVELRFAEPKLVEAATNALWTLHSFFELCLGKRQRYLKIEVELENQTQLDDDDAAPLSELLWSYSNERVSGEVDPTSYGDILIDPGAQNAEFAKVLSGWLNSNHSMGEARSRFASAFHAGSYGIDRIVGAANMFDLLPESHAPRKRLLDEEMREAVEECRARFRALPNSFARQSMLSALGRVDKASLPDKVCHRADLIKAAHPKKFSELHLPCTQAVKCRNHYVHGSEAAFDYGEEFNAFAFLTDTLEFVFAVSDLIELGWDYSSWRKKGSSLSHGFGAYEVNYDANMQRLKAIFDK